MVGVTVMADVLNGDADSVVMATKGFGGGCKGTCGGDVNGVESAGWFIGEDWAMIDVPLDSVTVPVLPVIDTNDIMARLSACDDNDGALE